MSEECAPIRLQRTAGSAQGFSRPDLRLVVEHDLGIVKIQVGDDGRRGLADAFGTLPPANGYLTLEDGVTVAWLAPGEWLLTGDALDVASVVSKIEASAGLILAVDLSHARRALLIEGSGARDALSAHCPLDLWPLSFPVGAAARSLFGDTIAFVARLEDQTDGARFRMVIDQTMAAYCVRMLAGPEPTAGADT